MARLSIAALAVALVACDKGADPDASRDYSDQEIADLEARLVARLEANKTRPCPRPVLDGESRPGSAREAQLALLEPTGGTKTCVDKATAAYRGLDVKTPVHEAPTIWNVDDECGAIFEGLVREAIAFEDACAPYVAGVRTPPGPKGSLDAFMRVSSITGVLAARASRQDPVAGLKLVAAGIRWGHDYTRGRTTLLHAFGVLSGRSMIATARQLVATLSPEAAREVAPSFDVLIATAPRFGPILLGDHELTSLHMGLAALKGAGWVPPGGVSEDMPRQPWTRNEAAQMLELSEEKAAFTARYCGERSSLAACYSNYVSHLGENLEAGFWAEYVQVAAQAASALIGVRLAIEVRRNGRCPTATELEEMPYRALRSSPTLGDRVDAKLENGMLVIAPPMWAVTDGYRTKGRPVEIECP